MRELGHELCSTVHIQWSTLSGSARGAGARAGSSHPERPCAEAHGVVNAMKLPHHRASPHCSQHLAMAEMSVACRLHAQSRHLEASAAL